MSARGLTTAVILLLLGAFGLGLYVLHLKHRAESPPAAARTTGPLSEPVAGTPAAITLLEASDEDGRLHRETVNIIVPEERGRRAREILRALIARYQQEPSLHPIDSGAEIREVYLVGGDLAIVDVNQVFAEGHRSGILVEELTVSSMVETLAANLPGITRMKLLVDGKERATLAGHADLLEPIQATEAPALAKQQPQ